MRRLMWIVLVLAIFWSGWWAVVGFGLKSAQTTWFQERRAQGWQADYKAIRLQGFPASVGTVMEDIVLADTAGGLVVSLPDLGFSMPTYWPGDVTMTLPDEEITFSSYEGEAKLHFENGVADLKLHPSATLALESLSALAGNWSIHTAEGSLIKADDLQLRMVQSRQQPETYHFIAESGGFRPGDVVRQIMRVPSNWPVAFETLTVAATVAFDKEWDLSAIETERPQPVAIHLKLAEAKWSDLRLFFAADLEMDEAGVPTGTLNIQAENWQVMLDLGEHAGILPKNLRNQIESGLGSLSRFSGDPKALDVQLNFKGGFMFAGFVPLGPAPRLRLR